MILSFKILIGPSTLEGCLPIPLVPGRVFMIEGEMSLIIEGK
jgi:hypothetical protein